MRRKPHIVSRQRYIAKGAAAEPDAKAQQTDRGDRQDNFVGFFHFDVPFQLRRYRQNSHDPARSRTIQTMSGTTKRVVAREARNTSETRSARVQNA